MSRPNVSFGRRKFTHFPPAPRRGSSQSGAYPLARSSAAADRMLAKQALTDAKNEAARAEADVLKRRLEILEAATEPRCRNAVRRRRGGARQRAQACRADHGGHRHRP